MSCDLFPIHESFDVELAKSRFDVPLAKRLPLVANRHVSVRHDSCHRMLADPVADKA
jgi:hypothetical protein